MPSAGPEIPSLPTSNQPQNLKTGVPRVLLHPSELGSSPWAHIPSHPIPSHPGEDGFSSLRTGSLVPSISPPRPALKHRQQFACSHPPRPAITSQTSTRSPEMPPIPAGILLHLFALPFPDCHSNPVAGTKRLLCRQLPWQRRPRRGDSCSGSRVHTLPEPGVPQAAASALP